MKGFILKYFEIFWFLLKKGISTSLYMFKFMIPITIGVKILQETGMIKYIGYALAPIMHLVGLPGEMGLVWASAMMSNIYGGLIAYFQILPSVPINVAQLTILATMILIAHTFAIELMVAHKSGVKFVLAFCYRFGFALLAGMLLHGIYSLTGGLEQIPRATKVLSTKIEPNLWLWGLGELKNYGMIMLWIVSLVFLLHILEKLGIIKLINKLLEPILKFLGIGPKLIPLTVIGMSLGLAYGGGLIIDNVKKEGLSPREVLYAILLLSLCHSLIEDSLLMISLGAHYTGVFIFRISFALIITYIFVRITRNFPEQKMKRYFYSRI